MQVLGIRQVVQKNKNAGNVQPPGDPFNGNER
jgi:hypothetical protein